MKYYQEIKDKKIYGCPECKFFIFTIDNYDRLCCTRCLEQFNKIIDTQLVEISEIDKILYGLENE